MRNLTTCFRIAVLIATLVTAASARAVELGAVLTHSFMAQPFTADVELVFTGVENANQLFVRQAAREVYLGANITRNPALDSLTTSVVLKNNSALVRVSSDKPVMEDHVHIFLELNIHEKHVVRSVTVWLTPAPAQATEVAFPKPTASSVEPHFTASMAPTGSALAYMSSKPIAVAESTGRRAPSRLHAAVAKVQHQINLCPPAAKADTTPASSAPKEHLSEQLGQIESRVKVLQDRMTPLPVIVRPAAPLGSKAPTPIEHRAITAGTIALGAALTLLVPFLVWRNKVALRAAVRRVLSKLRVTSESSTAIESAPQEKPPETSPPEAKD
jgi:pilus assembly protein FimV